MAKKNPFDEIAGFRENASKGVIDIDATLNKNFVCDEVKAIDEERRQIKFVISTKAVDRMGDTVDPDGWDLSQYKKNPTVLFAHDSRSLPIAKATDIRVEDGVLKSTAEFATRDMNEFADSVYKMYLGGFMRAVSVGFRPTDFKFAEDDDDRPYGIDFKKQELLEFSAVPIPANPEALIDAKSAGIDLLPLKGWAEKILDEWSEHKDLALPRKTIEDIRKQAAASKNIYLPTPTEQDNLLRKNLEAVQQKDEVKPEVKEEVESVVEEDALQEAEAPVEAPAIEEPVEETKEAVEEIALDEGVEDPEGVLERSEKIVESNVIGNLDDEEEEISFKELLELITENTDLIVEGTKEEVKDEFFDSRANRRAAKYAIDAFNDCIETLKDALAPYEPKKGMKPKPKPSKPKPGKKEIWEDEETLLSFMDDTGEEAAEEELLFDDVSDEDIQDAIKSALGEALATDLIAEEVRKHVKTSAGKT